MTAGGWRDPLCLSAMLAMRRHLFDYSTRGVDFAREVAPLPEECLSLVRRFLATPYPILPVLPDQLTINEYIP